MENNTIISKADILLSLFHRAFKVTNVCRPGSGLHEPFQSQDAIREDTNRGLTPLQPVIFQMLKKGAEIVKNLPVNRDEEIYGVPLREGKHYLIGETSEKIPFLCLPKWVALILFSIAGKIRRISR